MWIQIEAIKYDHKDDESGEKFTGFDERREEYYLPLDVIESIELQHGGPMYTIRRKAGGWINNVIRWACVPVPEMLQKVSQTESETKHDGPIEIECTYRGQ